MSDTAAEAERSALGRQLLASGALAPEWVPAFAAVPRSAFLPELVWPFDPASGRTLRVSRAEEPDRWRACAEQNVAVVTQWDDGAHPEADQPGRLSTSSMSMPVVVFAMLRDLDVRDGQRVLEIGTGTGYNAALLAHRLGADNVISVEVDPEVAQRARRALRAFGLPVEVVTGDGSLGHPPGAPYDRIIATCGLRGIPTAWLAQARPGGLLVAPWGTHYGPGDALVRLTVSADGDRASGPFTQPVEFMKLRSQRLTWAGHDAYVPRDVLAGGARSSTTLTEETFTLGPYQPGPFALGLRVPRVRHAVADRRQGTRPVWFYGLDDRSWAVVMFREGHSRSPVYQSGPRRLWDEVEAAHQWWTEHGRPGVDRFGLTITRDGTHHAWLDDPDRSWAL